jgi:hypothetical protein
LIQAAAIVMQNQSGEICPARLRAAAAGDAFTVCDLLSVSLGSGVLLPSCFSTLKIHCSFEFAAFMKVSPGKGFCKSLFGTLC